MNHFRLSMQLIHEAFDKNYEQITFHPGSDTAKLTDFRIYTAGQHLKQKYLYLLPGKQMPDLAPDSSGFCFITNQQLELHRFPIGCSFLIIQDCLSITELINTLQDTFEYYSHWDQSIHDALQSEHPLEEILEVSIPVFHNPMFIHDANFYILGGPRLHPRMFPWEREAKTGRMMIALQLINDFKVDLEYLNTLTCTRPSLYPAEQRSYPLLFMNLWNNGRYEGRICVPELEGPVLPGHYHLISYLAEVILSAINNQDLFWLSFGGNTEQFFKNILSGTLNDESAVLQMLYNLGWQQNHRYLCMRFEPEQHYIQHFSAAATISTIETQVHDCHAFLYQDGIVAITNLSIHHARSSEVLSSLSILLRESLLKMGVSTEIQDFFQLPKAYMQASTALELGMRSSNTSWTYRFDNYLLEYVLKKSGESMPPELLCSNKLLVLRHYDRNNNTEFYQTLKIFLRLERNVLQTAKTLYIHRSTLFYRLERIRKIADIDLDDPRERLILNLSYYILEQA